MKGRNLWFEFFSVFFAVIAAFALNNWNDNRKNNNAATKILAEIANGLEKDIEDIQANRQGHIDGIRACGFWRALVLGNEVQKDSLLQRYIDITRDFISVQNVSGYETLKSKGLELVQNDSLRFAIISLYEYNYNTLRKLEEEYYEMQYQENYYKEFNETVSPYFVFDSMGNISDVLPLNSLAKEEKNLLLSYLWKIHANRSFVLFYYDSIIAEIEKTRELIESELNE